MSTHIDGLGTVNTHVSVRPADEIARAYCDYEGFGAHRVLALEAPGNCHLVVVEGDLEDFARRVWAAVFGEILTTGSSDTSGLVRWEIDAPIEGSPAQIASEVWQTLFQRGTYQPSADDACVFTVDGVEIDLSDSRHAHLFTSDPDGD